MFGTKASSGVIQAWAQALAVGKELKSLYGSRGSVVLTGANTIATLLDGPEKVVMYDDLTLGDGTTATSLTASNRCKGLCVIVRGNLLVRNNATLHMTGRGARVDRNDDPFFPVVDFKIPNQVTLSSDRVSLARALKCIKDNGLAPWDQGTFQSIVASLYGFDLAVSQAGVVTLLSAAGCGASVNGNTYYQTWGGGREGGAGTGGGTGSGGSGGVHSPSTHGGSFRSGAGTPYSGGAGSGGAGNDQGNICAGHPCSRYSGPGGAGGVVIAWDGSTGLFPGDIPVANSRGLGGGGAGNPGGKGVGKPDGESGTGGKLVVICYGTITVHSGGKIEANGMAGGAGTGASSYPGGGGSGGGHVSIIYGGAFSNAGTVQAAGGAGGAGAGNGGPGGAGSVVTKTFTDMGWV